MLRFRVSEVHTSAQGTRFFPFPQRSALPGVRLFVFPHAGGSASAFQSWKKYLPDSVELRAAQLPGREARYSEGPVSDWREIAAGACAEIALLNDAPIVLFGHSMGSLLAFEVARCLRRDHEVNIAALVVSGHCAPQVQPRSPDVRHLHGRELLERLSELYGGIPPEALSEPELVNLIAPMVKADVTLVETYEYVDELPLHCPVQAFAGKSDPWVDPQELALWNRQTTGDFRSTLLMGDHFYLRNQLMERILLSRIVDLCEGLPKR